MGGKAKVDSAGVGKSFTERSDEKSQENDKRRRKWRNLTGWENVGVRKRDNDKM